ncbi:MAG TPA: peptidyl-prolyl cis-trans isomerase [Gemmatimonadales bacterium]
MQAFRNAAKPVVYLITITFLSWMILDLSGITGKGGFFTQTSAGSVDGQSIELRAYQQAVQNATTQRQQSGGGTMTLEATDQLRNDVWDQFVETTLVNDQINKYHITTSDDEVAQWIQNIPPNEVRTAQDFMTNGAFDLGKYQRWLQGPVGQEYVPTLEAQAREEILRTKLYSAVSADIFISDPELWQKYRDQFETVKISLTPIIGKNIVPDSAVSVSAAEIEAYYAAHRDDFKRDRTAFMSFVAVSRRLDASDSAAALARAHALRDSVTSGQPWADIVGRESGDTTTADKAGELGEWTKGDSKLDPALAKVAFTLPVNGISDPIATASGYEILQVTKKTGDKIDVRHLLVRFELAGAHRTIVDAQMDSLQRLGAERLDGAALDTVGRALKLNVAATGPVASGTRVVLGSYVIPDAGVWAFEAKKGETSPVIDGEVASYVFRLDSVQAGGIPPLVQVRDEVATKVREQKKEVRARAIADDFRARVVKGASMADAAKAMGLPNREFGPFTRIAPPIISPQLTGAAFGLPVGTLSPVIDAPEGLYVIRILEHTTADSGKFITDRDAFRKQMIDAARQERIREYIDGLKAAAKIVDRRNESNKTNAQNEAQVAQQTGTGKKS